MDEPGAVAIGVLHGNQLAAVVVIIPGDGHAVAVFDGGDEMREIGIVVVVLIGGVGAGIAVHELEHLDEVVVVTVVDVADGRLTSRRSAMAQQGDRVVDGGDATGIIAVKSDGTGRVGTAVIGNAIVADLDDITRTLVNLSQFGRAVNLHTDKMFISIRIVINCVHRAARDLIFRAVRLGGQPPTGNIVGVEIRACATLLPERWLWIIINLRVPDGFQRGMDPRWSLP